MKSIEIFKESAYGFCDFEKNNDHYSWHIINHRIRITFTEFGSGKDGSGFDSLVALMKKVGIERNLEDSLNDVFIDTEGFEYVIDSEALEQLKKDGRVYISSQPQKVR